MDQLSRSARRRGRGRRVMMRTRSRRGGPGAMDGFRASPHRDRHMHVTPNELPVAVVCPRDTRPAEHGVPLCASTSVMAGPKLQW